MKSSTELNKKGSFGLMLIGVPKGGKTSVAMAFPKPYFEDIDNNLIGPLRRMPKDYKFFYNNPNEIKEEHLRWKAVCEHMREAIASPEVETIVIDGISGLAIYLMNAIIFDSGAEAQKLKVAGEPVMQQTFWTPFRNRLAQLIMACRNSGKYFIVTCHETALQNEDGAVIAYRPLIPGQLKDNLAGFFSDCWRCEATDAAGKAKYTIRFKPKNLMQIGNSLNVDKADLDVTDKSPAQIWDELKKYFV